MARYTITLPDEIKVKLKAEAEKNNTSSSTLIAEYIEQHFSAVPSEEYEAQIQQLMKDYEARIHELNEQHTTQIAQVQQVRAEVQRVQDKAAADMQQANAEAAQNAAVQAQTISSLQNELETSKSHTKSLEKQLTDNVVTIKHLEQEAQEALTQSHVSEAAATKEAASHQVVVQGLQNEREKKNLEIKMLEDKLVTSVGIINDLKADKENLQKQLELVTLRLPPPRVGFWARLFGGGKKE